MQFSLSSKLARLNGKPLIIVTWLLRIALGAVFIFSGFVKAVDPWGVQYKIADYFAAWGYNLSDGLYLMAGCILAGFEFITGVMLVTGSYRRAMAIISTAFMSIMTVLTLYIWIADPVPDCGCFGDAYILSNAATFWKNIVLLIIAILLCALTGRVRPLIHHRFQWLALSLTACYIIIIQIIGYNIQPLIDFRPYPVGTDLAKLVNEVDPAEGIKFVYSKDGKTETFDANNLPDDDWTFVERIDPPENERPVSLSIMEGDEDVTSEVISNEGRLFILTITDPKAHGLARSEMANKLKAYADTTDASMIAVVAMPSDSIDSWATWTGANYDVYTADDTDLKMLVRGEAGLVMLQDGIIKWKTNLSNIDPYFPTSDEQVNSIRPIEESGVLPRITVIWLSLMFVVYLMSRFYRHWYQHRTKNKAVTADIQPPVEDKKDTNNISTQK